MKSGVGWFGLSKGTGMEWRIYIGGYGFVGQDDCNYFYRTIHKFIVSPLILISVLFFSQLYLQFWYDYMRMRIRKRTGLSFYETRRLKIAEALGSKMMKIIIYICVPPRGHPSAAVFYPAILFLIWHPDLVLRPSILKLDKIHVPMIILIHSHYLFFGRKKN